MRRTKLLKPRGEAEDLIERQIERGRELRDIKMHDRRSLDSVLACFEKWDEFNNELLNSIFDTPKFAEEYSFSGVASAVSVGGSPSLTEEIQHHRKNAQQKVHRLESIKDRLSIIDEAIPVTPRRKPAAIDSRSLILRIWSRFPSVVKQMRKRYGNRATLDVKDEYDVQDLLRSLLHIFFKDIRKEESTPSYAGGSSRMDFLLKREEIVVETKFARETLKDNELGEQLLIDIAKYSAHPHCKMLLCLVYDPDGQISNPRGIESDLSRKRDGLDVVVSIVPTH
jgi:hypothetical protein